MTQFARRRTIGVTIVVIATILLAVGTAAMQTALRRPGVVLGWILFVLVVSLAAYRLRKQIPVLPVGSSASWLQFHIYAGLLTLPVFLLHTGMRMPHGMIEAPLGVVFLCVFLSGVTGLILTRHIPPRLRNRGEEVVFERIPAYVRQLREEAEACVLGTGDAPPSDVVGELFVDQLQSFFQRPRNLFRHILHSRKPRADLIRALEDARRFLTAGEQSAIDQLIALVIRKDDLDYQYAMQSILKSWLFVHVPLTWALLVLAAFHILVARAYN